MARTIETNAASHFSGYTHHWMDAQTAAGIRRARRLLAIGVTQLAIEKAQKHR
jgi:hypothetical protein